jgi:hypothetical protein
MPLAVTIDSILTWLLQLEDANLTGVITHLDDGTTWTRLGITNLDAAFFPFDFLALPLPEAISAAKIFYYQKYWLAMHLSLAQSTPEWCAAVLSCAVNCGLGGARLILNHALTLDQFNEAWKDYYARKTNNPAYLKGWYARVDAIYPKLQGQ